MQSYHLSVPTKAYIRKYFTVLYGHPIQLTHANDFGDTILTKMISRPLCQVNKRVLNLSDRDYNDTLRFQLPADFFYRLETELTEQQVYNINRYLENCFKTDMLMVVCCAAFFGVEIRTSIEGFAKRYHIELEEDISYEALQKCYYRYRKSSVAANHFLLQMSTPFKMSFRA